MKMPHTFKLLTLAAALSSTALVYAQDRTPAPAGQPATENPRAVENANGNAAQAQQNADATKSMATRAAQTDGQILQIVRSLNDAEIKQAEFVMDESDSTELKVVAQSIINDHEDANEKIDDLLDGDLSLDESPLNETLAEQAEATFERLDELEGSQLDCQYLQAQVEQHEMAIDIAKNDLLPDAKNAEVRAFLTEMTPKLENHMMSAQDTMRGMSGCAQAANSNRGVQGNLGNQENRSGAAPTTPNRSTTPAAGERQ